MITFKEICARKFDDALSHALDMKDVKYGCGRIQSFYDMRKLIQFMLNCQED